MKLVIGCPVARRDWILPWWFDHVERACTDASVEPPTYVFVLPRDDPCRETIEKRASLYVMLEAPSRPNDRRDWRPKRYQEMVELRNDLLFTVRMIEPDAFLSLDSDILLAPTAITELLAELGNFDAVGGKCFMTPSGRMCPSYANMGRDSQLVRRDAVGCFEVDVIMAIKLMNPTAYNVDYQFHMQGEDIGWSLAARQAGLHLGWTGRVCSKHVLDPSMLNQTDVRCGF
jgi:hypothetical protein